MQKKWYTVFLMISLILAVFYTGGKQVYEVSEQLKEMQSEEKSEQNFTEPEEEAVTEETVIEKEESQLGEKEEEASFEKEELETENPGKPENKILFTDEFTDVLFIGDSRTVGLYEYGRLGEAQFFADNGMSVFNLWKSSLPMKNGKKMTLEQVLEKKQYRVIHFMLGINELGYSREQVVKKYRESVEKVQNMQPTAQIVLGGNLHVTAERAEGDAIFNNENINGLNEEIKKIADSFQDVYLDVNVLFDDKEGNLDKIYTTDGVHILGKYYMDWAAWLKEEKMEENSKGTEEGGNSLLDAPSQMNYN